MTTARMMPWIGADNGTIVRSAAFNGAQNSPVVVLASPEQAKFVFNQVHYFYMARTVPAETVHYDLLVANLVSASPVQ